MTHTKDEALRIALKALEFALHVGFDESSESQIKKGDKAWQQHQQAITAIKQALAAPVEPDWKAEYLKSVESGCITLDELREARVELEATNRQVEILSDALAESRREVAALKAVQPVAWIADTKRGYNTVGYECKKVNALPHGTMLYTTPPAQPAPVKVWEAEGYDAVMQEMQEMLKGMK